MLVKKRHASNYGSLPQISSSQTLKKGIRVRMIYLGQNILPFIANPIFDQVELETTILGLGLGKYLLFRVELVSIRLYDV